MRVYKVTLMIIDFDNIGVVEMKEVIENTHYPNRCISPKVKRIEGRDIGEWSDDNPLNSRSASDETFRKLFE